MQQHEFIPQLLLIFLVLSIADNSVVNRAHLLAGWGIIMPHAFGAARWINFVVLHSHRNRLVRALRLTHIAIDTACSN